MPDLDWDMLSRPAQTVVVFMGVGTAPHISKNLIAAGRAGTTPVAIIQNGTRPDQKISYGRLADLPHMITRHEVSAPALLIIGEVSAIPATTLEHCLEGWHDVCASETETGNAQNHYRMENRHGAKYRMTATGSWSADPSDLRSSWHRRRRRRGHGQSRRRHHRSLFHGSRCRGCDCRTRDLRKPSAPMAPLFPME